MPSYSNWESLVKAANAKCDVVLKKDVEPVAKKIMKEHIQSDIYKAYSPKYYQRRNQLPNMVTGWVLTDEHELHVTSTAPANKSLVPGYSFNEGYLGAFLKLLEVGNMGFWRKNFPRPAVTNAQKEIDTSSAITAAIETGIAREIG